MRCLGLFSLLPGGVAAEAAAPSQRLALLRTALAFDGAAAVQDVAAQALCDLALIRCSVPSFDLFGHMTPLAWGQ